MDLNELAAALEGDFDPDEFSAKMAAAFADAYSDADDEFDPTQGDPLADLSADEEGEDAVHAAVKGGQLFEQPVSFGCQTVSYVNFASLMFECR